MLLYILHDFSTVQSSAETWLMQNHAVIIGVGEDSSHSLETAAFADGFFF